MLLCLWPATASGQAPHKFVDPCPVTGDISDPSVRVSWLKCVVQLGNDECEGKVPLAPNSDLGLPCAGRSITNGALGKLLVSDGKDTEGCMALLRTTPPGPSFNGQSWPAVYYLFNHNFNATDRAFLMESIKATAATYHGNVTGTAAQAAVGSVGTDVSYNNIYYMGMVNGILFGEIAGDEEATASGYQLLDNWLQYVQVIGDTPCVQEGNTRSLHMLCTLPHHNTHHTQSVSLSHTQTADIHEFASPTYYWVQINALYMGHAFARRPGARAVFKRILDHTWADVCANYFMPSQVCRIWIRIWTRVLACLTRGAKLLHAVL